MSPEEIKRLENMTSEEADEYLKQQVKEKEEQDKKEQPEEKNDSFGEEILENVGQTVQNKIKGLLSKPVVPEMINKNEQTREQLNAILIQGEKEGKNDPKNKNIDTSTINDSMLKKGNKKSIVIGAIQTLKGKKRR